MAAATTQAAPSTATAIRYPTKGADVDVDVDDADFRSDTSVDVTSLGDVTTSLGDDVINRSCDVILSQVGWVGGYSNPACSRMTGESRAFSLVP